jgi:predicted transcriptional regulator
MATVKMTFTLDEATAHRLNVAASRLHKPKSEVVREAIQDYYAKTDRLSEAERQRMLRVLKEYMAKPPTRPQKEVDRELRELRRARRSGGRLHPAE